MEQKGENGMKCFEANPKIHFIKKEMMATKGDPIL